jgi:hypothetical protein
VLYLGLGDFSLEMIRDCMDDSFVLYVGFHFSSLLCSEV